MKGLAIKDSAIKALKIAGIAVLCVVGLIVAYRIVLVVLNLLWTLVSWVLNTLVGPIVGIIVLLVGIAIIVPFMFSTIKRILFRRRSTPIQRFLESVKPDLDKGVTEFISGKKYVFVDDFDKPIRSNVVYKGDDQYFTTDGERVHRKLVPRD